MWIVRLALRRPYTFVVAAPLLLLLTPFVLLRAPTDIPFSGTADQDSNQKNQQAAKHHLHDC